VFFTNLDIPDCYVFIDTYKKVAWLRKTLLDSSIVAFDIETNHPTFKSKEIFEWEKTATEVVCGISYAWGRDSVEDPWKPGNAAYLPLTRADDSPYWGARQDASKFTYSKNCI
jgi:hypothetical protein